MPSTYTHYRFGKDVLGCLEGELKRIALKHEEIFLIGLHGPDILFYYGALWNNRVNEVGYELHKKDASAFFEHARKQINKTIYKEQSVAYILGFICHFALDSECHGYIEHVIHQGKLTHTEIETDFERMLLTADGYKVSRYNTATHIKASSDYARVIAPFFNGVTNHIVTEYEVFKALKSMKRYNGLLLPSNFLKVGVIKGLLQLTNNYEEMHGLIISENGNPICEESNAELMRRYQGAVHLSQRLMIDFYEKVETKESLDIRFERTFGPDTVEMTRYEQGVYNA